MTQYAALLRGIMPTNPNMRNEKLRGVFESLGFSNVQTVISSGNVIFEYEPAKSNESEDIPLLEARIEKALADQLGIKSTTFIRSKKELESIIKKDPFKGTVHNKETYLIVTFLKKKPRELYATIDLTKDRTPNFMADIEKTHGKEVTTRTWKTVERILKKMQG